MTTILGGSELRVARALTVNTATSITCCRSTRATSHVTPIVLYTKMDAPCNKLATVVGWNKVTALAMVDVPRRNFSTYKVCENVRECLCSCRVRGVEGSCAKHLTIEFYTVVMLLTFILIIISIPSPPHSFISGLKPSFSANPSQCSLPSLLQDDSTDSPDCLPILLSMPVFTFYFFLFFPLVGVVREIKLSHVSFWFHVKIASRIS